MCNICKVTPCKIFKLSCLHGICMEDIRGYLENALGDISQFPVKVQCTVINILLI